LLSEHFADAAISLSAPHRSPPSAGGTGGAELPAGTITFLLTDIEGSTRLWESDPEAMEVALQRHDRLLADVIEGHGGQVITSKGEGDSCFAVFPSAVAAVEAAGECQLGLRREVWPTGVELLVRMGLHTGGGSGSWQRSCRARADQPLRPGKSRRPWRAGAPHQDNA
jgi:class 3 adenylate cyclase